MGRFESFANASARFAGRPAMLAIALLLALLGILAFLSGNERFLSGIALGISIVTLLLVPILQASQNRDGAALHAKIDELIKIHEKARNTLIGVEKHSHEDIERVRQDEEDDAGRVAAGP